MICKTFIREFHFRRASNPTSARRTANGVSVAGKCLSRAGLSAFALLIWPTNKGTVGPFCLQSEQRSRWTEEPR
jgi:hypothetical protein